MVQCLLLWRLFDEVLNHDDTLLYRPLYLTRRDNHEHREEKEEEENNNNNNQWQCFCGCCDFDDEPIFIVVVAKIIRKE